MMYSYYRFYKPYGFLSQFSDENGNPGLNKILDLKPDIYPVGRLDLESEGLLILTNDKKVNNLLLNPIRQHQRTYLVQVEGIVTQEAMLTLEKGVSLNINKKQYQTLPAQVRCLTNPGNIPERTPPIRFRKTIPTSWIELSLIEGKNHQVRKMTAKVGFPTLRLIRSAIELVTIENLEPGEYKELPGSEFYRLCGLYNPK